MRQHDVKLPRPTEHNYFLDLILYTVRWQKQWNNCEDAENINQIAAKYNTNITDNL